MDHQVRLRSRLLLLLACLGWAPMVMAQATPEDIYSDDIQYVGSIGDKYPIEVLLRDMAKLPALGPGECMDVTGTYYYHRFLLPINLKGRACADGHSLQLSNVDASGNETERFAGTWSADASELAGHWTLSKSRKQLSFTLKAYHLQFDPAVLDRFFAMARYQVAERPFEGYQMTLKDIVGERGRGRIQGFVARNGEVAFFSPGRLDLWYQYDDAGSGCITHETFQLLPSAERVRILYVIQSMAAKQVPGYEREWNFEERCNDWIRLMGEDHGHEAWQQVPHLGSGPDPTELAQKDALASKGMVYTTSTGLNTGTKQLIWDGKSLILR